MIRRPPRSTLDRSSAASDVYKRQDLEVRRVPHGPDFRADPKAMEAAIDADTILLVGSVSYTHLRAHETVLDLVCRLLLEKKNTTVQSHPRTRYYAPAEYSVCSNND